MRLFTSSSEARFVAALVATLALLTCSWEVVLRQRAGATVDVSFAAVPASNTATKGAEFLIFGNCLMMTGVSPTLLQEELPVDEQRMVLNIAAHEQSPIAFFDYLRRAHHYPDVIVANVSSWINGTNFEQEGELVAHGDPLHLFSRDSTAIANEGKPTTSAHGPRRFQDHVESSLGSWATSHVRTFGRRYHLFDYGLFMGKLARTQDLDTALYQLNMQSWFRVRRSESDGQGFLALDIDYRADWQEGLDRMAERSLERLQLSRLLTPHYWELLEKDVADFSSRGTRVFLVRMPEHPKIRAFNDKTYDVENRLRGIEVRTGAPHLDLSHLGGADGVRLFDAVHPDAQAARVTSLRIAVWLRERLAAKTALPNLHAPQETPR